MIRQCNLVELISEDKLLSRQLLQSLMVIQSTHVEAIFQVSYKQKKQIVNQFTDTRDYRHQTVERTPGEKREVEAQDSVYVIQSKSRSSVKGTSLD